MGLGKSVFVSSVLLCLFWAPVARAGDTYVLDIDRSSPTPQETPGIVAISPSGEERRLELHTTDPRVELPLKEPVGIDFDEANGRLYVTDAGGVGGYKGKTDFGKCSAAYEESCGALLAIDPASGEVELVAGPSGPGVNRMENPYGVLVLAGGKSALVADQGTTRIIEVDLATGEQSVFNKRLPGGAYPDGLRAPWGLAEDPVTHDILVANSGTEAGSAVCTARAEEIAEEKAHGKTETQPPCELVPTDFGSGISVPQACYGNDGYVLRLSPTGVPLRIYCDDEFRHPRNIAVDAEGRIFVVDPITQIARNPIEPSSPLFAGAETGFGGVFEIDPSTGYTQLVAAGGEMATASGLDFGPDGSSLLIADETLNRTPATPPAEEPCVNGCGGLIKVDGGGLQSATVRTAANRFVDPIAVAVDRDGRPRPSLRLESVPYFFGSLDRREGEPKGSATSITELPFIPVRGESKIVLLCVKGTCTKRTRRRVRGKHGKVHIKKTLRARILATGEVERNKKTFTLQVPENLLRLKTCPKTYVLAHNRCVLRSSALQSLPRHTAPIANKYVAIVSKTGFVGRYQAFTVVPGAEHAEVELLPGPGNSGCLREGATSLVTSPKGRHKGRKAGKKAGQKAVSQIVPCPPR